MVAKETFKKVFVAHLVKNLSSVWETWVQSLGWEDPLEKGTAIHTPVFWPGEFHGRYSPWGQKSRTRPGDFHFLHSKRWVLSEIQAEDSGTWVLGCRTAGCEDGAVPDAVVCFRHCWAQALGPRGNESKITFLRRVHTLCALDLGYSHNLLSKLTQRRRCFHEDDYRNGGNFPFTNEGTGPEEPGVQPD